MARARDGLGRLLVVVSVSVANDGQGLERVAKVCESSGRAALVSERKKQCKSQISSECPRVSERGPPPNEHSNAFEGPLVSLSARIGAVLDGLDWSCKRHKRPVEFGRCLAHVSQQVPSPFVQVAIILHSEQQHYYSFVSARCQPSQSAKQLKFVFRVCSLRSVLQDTRSKQTSTTLTRD